LPPLAIDGAWIERVRCAMPELPGAMRERFARDYPLTAYDAAMLTQSREMAAYFEDAVRELEGEAKAIANWILGEVSAALNKSDVDIAAAPVAPAALAGLVRRIVDGTISHKTGKDVFEAMWAGEGEADTIIARKGLMQISDEGAIETLVDAVLAAHPAIVAEYKAGKEKAFNSLVGKVMGATKGKANPAQVNAVLKRKLDAGR
jgi:aspartyl-tRNA(Asn)/glutamyl-tRNA(Gln) amidotransferase subunit B